MVTVREIINVTRGFNSVKHEGYWAWYPKGICLAKPHVIVFIVTIPERAGEESHARYVWVDTLYPNAYMIRKEVDTYDEEEREKIMAGLEPIDFELPYRVQETINLQRSKASRIFMKKKVECERRGMEYNRGKCVYPKMEIIEW